MGGRIGKSVVKGIVGLRIGVQWCLKCAGQNCATGLEIGQRPHEKKKKIKCGVMEKIRKCRCHQGR